MIRILLCGFAALILQLIACTGSTTSTATDTTNSTIKADSLVANPDNGDLLQTLQGKWQSEDDNTYIVEIVGDKMNHYNGGKVSITSEIEIDASCLSNACKVDSMDLSDGWCFVEKGQYDAQCNLVLKCTKQALQYRAIGAANATLRFTKK
ncbi:MAG: hypothetical protein LH618_08520 [Saprospiraceae bacterium]|nr:hypothetical protein [Saprospiraceae bacterium]